MNPAVNHLPGNMVPLGDGVAGHSVMLLDPWDQKHSVVGLLAGGVGFGKTITADVMLSPCRPPTDGGGGSR